jgi:hypothetical protein
VQTGTGGSGFPVQSIGLLAIHGNYHQPAYAASRINFSAVGSLLLSYILLHLMEHSQSPE